MIWWTAIKAFLAPVVEALKILWRSICAAAVWCLRQAVAAPAWTAVMAGVVLLALWCSGGIGYRRGYDQGEIDGKAAITADLDQCRANKKTLESALKDQSAQIAALGKQGEALRADLKVLGAKYQAETEALRARLAALAASKPAGKTECERAISGRAQIIEDRSR